MEISNFLAAAGGAFIASFAAEWVKALVRAAQVSEQHRDGDLAEIQQMLADLEILAERYWSLGTRLGQEEPLVRGKIVARQQYVLSLVADLFSGRTEKYDCDVAFTEVMTHLSGGDFGPGCQAEPERLQGVYQSILEFKHVVISRRRQLPRKWLA